jgi:hypothetical protein
MPSSRLLDPPRAVSPTCLRVDWSFLGEQSHLLAVVVVDAAAQFLVAASFLNLF